MYLEFHPQGTTGFSTLIQGHGLVLIVQEVTADEEDPVYS